jgi:predicted transcriptional regulator
MAKRTSRAPHRILNLGPLESRVMDVVWRLGDASVRDVSRALTSADAIAYTTVMTVMTRLVDKGLLGRNLRGRAYVYRTTMSQGAFEEAQARGQVRNLIERFGDVAVAQFAEELTDTDPGRARKLAALLARRRPR